MNRILRVLTVMVLACSVITFVPSCKKEKTPAEKLKDKMKKDANAIKEEAKKVKDKATEE